MRFGIAPLRVVNRTTRPSVPGAVTLMSIFAFAASCFTERERTIVRVGAHAHVLTTRNGAAGSTSVKATRAGVASGVPSALTAWTSNT